MPRLRLFRFALIAAFLTVATPALAGTGIWTPLGPEAAQVTALAVDPADPDVVYAGTYRAGVFRSADGGTTWTASGLADTLLINSLAFDPRRPGTVYALLLYDGLFKSTDGGATWTRPWLGVHPAGSIAFQHALVVDPRSGVLYAATDAGLYRSADGGTTWKPRGVHLLGPVRSLAIDASGTLYAGPLSGGLWKSADQGASWRAVHQGLPAGTPVTALAVDPEKPWNLLAGTGKGLYRSTNSGRRWHAAGGPAQPVASVIFQRGGGAYAGYETTPSLLRSADGGASWQSAGTWSGAPIAALAAAPGRVLAGLSGSAHPEQSTHPALLHGIFRSLDAGATWERSESGLYGLVGMSSVAVDPADPHILYASTADDLWKSIDGGASWLRLDLGPSFATPRWISDILIDPARPATVWLSLHGPLLRSDDAGATWRALTPLPTASRSDLALDPRAPQALWRTGREGIYHSPDGGLTWEFRPIEPRGLFQTSDFYDVKVDPRDPEVIYAAGAHLEGRVFVFAAPRIYRSTDGGQTWQRRDDGISPVADRIEEIALDPVHPDTLYAASPYALYRSTNAGLSWEAVAGSGDGGNSFQGVVAAPAGPGTPAAVYAARSFPAAVLRSIDGGATWTPMRRGLRAFFPWALAIDPHDPGHILTATYNGGLYSYTVPR